MNGFFLLLTINLLVMVQAQTPGDMGNNTIVPDTNVATTVRPIVTPKNPAVKTTTKPRSGASVLSDMGGSSFLFFLANTLICLFYLS